MKYISSTVRHSTEAALLFALLVLLGCATAGSKLKIVTDGDVLPDMLPTLHYMPTQETDSEGILVPYVARENPYLSQRSRVKKDSVVGFIEARRAYKAGNLDQAKTLFLNLAEQDRGLSGPWVMLGDIAMEQGGLQQAVEHYVKAIAVNKQNVNAYLRLAKTQRVQGHFLHAQNTYAKVLSIWPDFPEAHLNLAVLYDVYLNHPLRAQKHMETYQFLTDGKNNKIAGWLAEIQRRTGVAPSFEQASVQQSSLPNSP